jgi:hypothetical protein
MAAQRKSIDCRDYPSEKNCLLKISGTEEEVLDTAVHHAASASRSSRCLRTNATERCRPGSRSAFSDPHSLLLCFDVEFCK